MSHVTPTGERESRGELLRRTLDEMGLSNKELARRLAGEGATHTAIENKRGQVKDWAEPDSNFVDSTAERLAQALDKPGDYFKVPRRVRARISWGQQVAAIRSVVIELAERQGVPVPEILRQAADGEAA